MHTDNRIDQTILSTLLAMKEEQGRVAARIEAVDEKVDSVLAQTTKTNGRVTNLEHWKIKVIAIAGVFGTVGAAIYQWFTGRG